VFGRNEEKNQRVLAELKAIGVPSLTVKIDLTHRAEFEPALSKTVPPWLKQLVEKVRVVNQRVFCNL
jgi:hypothetical protein